MGETGIVVIYLGSGIFLFSNITKLQRYRSECNTLLQGANWMVIPKAIRKTTCRG